jgi:hypothetical protein
VVLDEAIRLLKGGEDGVREWNQRRARGEEMPTLSAADLRGTGLRGANLSRANLHGAALREVVLREADLSEADLSRADLRGADLRGADFSRTALRGADLRGAVLRNAVLRRADLVGAVLRRADLVGAVLRRADLRGADLSGAVLRVAVLSRADLSDARCLSTVFGYLDLSEVRGLESIRHEGPSAVDVDTLRRSRGLIPEAFLRGCGFTPWEVLAADLYRTDLAPPGLADLQYRIFDAWTKGRSLISGCFLSHSWKDSRFADALCDRLMAEGVNVWLDRRDMVAGTIQEQLWRAIQLHHVVILVLSNDSVQSDWVENELDMARRKEKAEKRAVLCPICLDDSWKAKVAAEDGAGDPFRGLWRTLTGKFIVDFTGWEARSFDGAFQKLLRGLKTNYGPPSPA